MFYLKRLYVLVIYFCFLHIVHAQDTVKLKKPQSFSVSGSIGASANFYTSNEGDYIPDERDYTRPTSAWNLYGSINPRIGQFSFPLSFVVNKYSGSNVPAYVQMGISPTYKWARLHLGYQNIPFSPFTFEGQSFRGVGIELNPGILRFAAFTGRLNRSLDEDTSFLRSRLPQYSRVGYGIKLGIGNSSRYFDLIFFHAKDDSNSAKTFGSFGAQENAVVGGSFKIIMLKRLILTGDGAFSGLTQDLSFNKVIIDASQVKLSNFVSKFFAYNASSVASYAGQSSLSYYSNAFKSNVTYRRVQPEFKSLGTPYMINDVELISTYNNFSVAKGRLNLNTNFSNQHNNLSKKLNTRLQTQVANISANTYFGTHVNLNLNYSGYDLKQKDGVIRLNDTLRLNQHTSQFGINPSYNLTKGNLAHVVYGNFNYSRLSDKNQKTSRFTTTTNLSSSLNYTLGFVNKPYNISITGLLSDYKQSVNSYKSYGVTLGTSAQFLKKQNLNIQGNIGCLFNHFIAGSVQSTRQRNLTYSISSGYLAGKHSFSLYANYVYTPPNAITDMINKAIPYAVATKNLASGISYNYSF